MLSFKVFDRSASDELLVAYRRATALILDAAVHQAVAGEDSDFANVRESVAGLSARLSSPDAKTPDVLVAAGAASEAVRDYLRQAGVSVRARRLELEAVVGMLTATMSEIASASGRSITRLHDIERRLAKSHELYDVRDLRQQMSECLAEVREEAA